MLQKPTHAGMKGRTRLQPSAWLSWWAAAVGEAVPASCCGVHCLALAKSHPLASVCQPRNGSSSAVGRCNKVAGSGSSAGSGRGQLGAWPGSAYVRAQVA